MSREQVPILDWNLVRTRYRQSRQFAGSTGFWQLPHLRFRDTGSLPVPAANAFGRRHDMLKFSLDAKEATA